jgi:hypothetical protein
MRTFKVRASAAGTFLCVLLIGVLAAQPMLRYGLPSGDDTLYHIQRTASLLRSWQEGVFFPRWSADLVYGFGYPVFNYYAPLVYYLTASLAAIGLTATQAVTWVAIAFCFLQAIGAWLWLREHTHPLAAYIGSVSYTLAPYTVGNITGRGALAEHAALGIVPFVCWSIARLSRSEGRAQVRWWLLATLLLSAFWLSHNVSAVLLSVIIAAYLFYCWVSQGRRLILLTVPGFSALIVAFFWIPVLDERSLVQLDLLHAPPWANYYHHFLNLGRLFAWPEPTDRLLVFQPRSPEFNSIIIVVSLVINIIGIVLSIVRKAKFNFILSLFSLLTLILCIFMMNELSSNVWKFIDILKFLQFPWRFHAIATLCISFLCANATDLLITILINNHKNILILVAAVWLGFSVAFVFVRQVPVNTVMPSYRAEVKEVAEFEYKTTFIGTTTAGEYLPAQVFEKPPFHLSIFKNDSSYEYRKSDRLAVELSSSDLIIHQKDYSPYRYALHFTTPTSATLIFRTFYFPGWQATLNGAPVALSAQPPHGLLRLDAPPGTHRAEIIFASTPLRSLAEALSIIGLGLSFGLTILLHFVVPRRAVDSQVTQDKPLFFPWEAVMLASAIMLGVKTLWVDRAETPFAFTRFDGRTVRDVDIEVQKSFGDGLVLIGADMPEQTNPTARDLKFTLFWRAARTLRQEYSTSIHLVDELGALVGQSDNQHPDGFPTKNWPTDKYGRDRHTLFIYPGTPPGIYRLFVKVYPYGQPQSPLPVYNESGSPIGTEVLLGTITLDPAPWHVPLETLKAERVLDAPAGDPVALVAFNQPPAHARPGDSLRLTLFWKAQRAPQRDLQTRLCFVDAQGRSVACQDFPPVITYPTSRWQAGDLWRGTHRILVPRTLASGSYSLTLQIPPTTSFSLSSLFVEPIARAFEPPQLGQRVGARFLEVGDLFAAQVPAEARPGETLNICLIWKATREADRAYKVFVHIVDAQGNYASGSDSEPAKWSRPTTSWVEGEYILDEHTPNAPLAEGIYEVRVGLYSAESGERVPLVSGETFVALPQRIQVKP